MSTDDPRPPAGEPPWGNGPFHERPHDPGLAHANGSPRGGPDGGAPGGEPPHDDAGQGPGPGGPPPGGGPYGGPGGPPGGGSGEPYGGGPYGGGPYGGGPYGGGPHGGNPYGGPFGAQDPLAGMPPLANRGRRLLARIIDAIIVGVPLGLILSFGLDVHYTTANGDLVSGQDAGKQTVAQLVLLLVYLVYEGMMLSWRGQTVGKMVMRIRVAMLDNGSIPTAPAAWIRAAVYSLPEIVPCCGAVFWLVNVLWCTWDRPYRQCLHDKAAKTVVVSTEHQSRRTPAY